MASTYVNDLRLNEMATGDQSGSWGTVTNTNLELIGEAFSFGTENITTNADTHTTTIADGQADPGRSMFLKYTGRCGLLRTVLADLRTSSFLRVLVLTSRFLREKPRRYTAMDLALELPLLMRFPLLMLQELAL